MCRNYNEENYKTTERDEDTYKCRDIIFVNRKTLHYKDVSFFPK